MATILESLLRCAVFAMTAGGLLACATARSAPSGTPPEGGPPPVALPADAGTSDAPDGGAAGPSAGGGPATPCGPGKWLTESDVTPERLLALFREVYFNKARLDEDGDIEISDGNMKHWVRLDTRRTIITFSSPWAMKKSVPNEKKLAFVNTLNDELLYVRFSLSNSARLWPDYQLSYEGGIPVHSILVAFRNFVQIMLEAVHARDPDDLIGRD